MKAYIDTEGVSIMPQIGLNELLGADKQKSKVIFDTSGSIYIENYGGISSYTPEKIVFQNQVQLVGIEGLDLYLEGIERDCVYIKGKIKQITLLESGV